MTPPTKPELKSLFKRIATLERELEQSNAAISAAVSAEREALAPHLERMTNYCEYWLLAGKVMTGSNDKHVLQANIDAARTAIRARSNGAGRE